MSAKGVGELGTIAVSPTIVAVMVDVLSHLGVTHNHMPVKSQKVWRVLGEQ